MSLLGGLLGVVLAKYFFIPGMVKGMETSPMAPFMLNFKVRGPSWRRRLASPSASACCAGFVPAIRSSQVRIVDGLRRGGVSGRYGDTAEIQLCGTSS